MRTRTTKMKLLVMLLLLVTFIIYNVSIYTENQYKQSVKLSETALQGQLLWQENNCWSCHQIYGLGGYLGPDLTNIYSNSNKGPGYIKVFLNSGVKSMPKFDFSEGQKEAIVSYLKHIDSTGYYPNFEASFKPSGWVELKYKDEK